MSLPRFFLEEQVVADEVSAVFPLRLSADDFKHARVLRLEPGEHIAVVDAAADYFECAVERIDADELCVSIARHEGVLPARPQVILLQGLAKGDKMDDVIRHATELGVSAFIPLACARSVMKIDAKKAPKKLERWRAIAKSAAMQSGQPAIPEVLAPLRPAEASKALAGCTALCVCWEEAPTTVGMGDAIRAGLKATRNPVSDARIAIVIGPEGGLTQDEVDAFLDACPNARLVSLGSSILRTETAGIVAPALALYELGCLGG